MTRFSVTRYKNKPWLGWCLFLVGCAVTAAAYWPGLSGGFLFDDYPNIVDNKGVQPSHADIPSLINAALSSPSSEFKRPLASLSFAANYVLAGLDPYWMKFTNVLIHLLNGLLAFLLARELIDASHPQSLSRTSITAAILSIAWMLLPINLTGVLYIVQRMESLANVLVLFGLTGYVKGRRLMLASSPTGDNISRTRNWQGFSLCVTSVVISTAIGVMAKETAAMLPLYAFLVEWILFGFRKTAPTSLQPLSTRGPGNDSRRDWRLYILYLLILALPLLVGFAWLLPGLLQPGSWATRNFTMGTRLLSEARVVMDYIYWTILPTPTGLSFYHDDFPVSQGILSPWTTLPCILGILCMVASIAWLRPRHPLTALGLALFFGCQLLTATILPLELVYEHRNYFASFGLLLALIPWLATGRHARAGHPPTFALARNTLLIGLLLLWGSETAMTAVAWGSPLTLAETLAERGPDSPRAQYELGRTYIIYSHYDPASPFTALAYGPLERASKLPDASILPEQALIFMNSRMHLPLKDAWWSSMISKLKSRKATVQDESSLGSLTECARDRACDLPTQQMMEAYEAALSHPAPSARLLAMYGDYAWNVLADHALGLRMSEAAVQAAPSEPAYYVTLIKMSIATGQLEQAKDALQRLKRLNIGGRLSTEIQTLQGMLDENALLPVTAQPRNS